jgi:hypothetical protein
MIRRLWKSRWSIIRLAIAIALLVVALSDNPARLVRMQLASMPSYDYLGEAHQLRMEKRYGEALVVVDEGIADASPEVAQPLLAERERIVSERDSIFRRIKDVGKGALMGRGDSVEELIGAVGADMLVVGDVRDLLLQSAHWAIDGEADPVILSLSGIGLATTLAPEVDWGVSLMKIGKKMGALSGKLGEALATMAKRGAKVGREEKELTKVAQNVGEIAAHSSPAGAIRLMRYADDPKDLEKIAKFVKKERGAAFALHVAGKEGVRLVKDGAEGGEALILAAKKGDRGMAWLRSGNARLFRPHPLIGLSKSIYKGTAPQLFNRVVNDYFDPLGVWIIVGLAGWTCLEACILYTRLVLPRREPREIAIVPATPVQPA